MRWLGSVALAALLWAGGVAAQVTTFAGFEMVVELNGVTAYTLTAPTANCTGHITVIDNTGVTTTTHSTITATSGLINGQASFIFNQNHMATTFFWDGTNWSAM